MTKREIKQVIGSAIGEASLVSFHMRYHTFGELCIPLKAGEKLFLVANEDDFLLDGYNVYRFKDVTKAAIKNDKCDEILKSEGITTNIAVPDIDLGSWKSVFESLKRLGKNVIVQGEAIKADEEDEFTIGAIERIFNSYAYVRHFDADGIWQEKPYRIQYSEITSITFESRYVTVFSKHIPPVPIENA
jgi:hypothetical protein